MSSALLTGQNNQNLAKNLTKNINDSVDFRGEDQRLDSISVFSFDEDEGMLESEFSLIFEYNTDQSLHKSINREYFSGPKIYWVEETEFFYDANGNILREETYAGQEGDPNLKIIREIDRVFNGDNQILESTEILFNGSEVPFYGELIEYTYEDGLQIEEELHLRDVFENVWNPFTKWKHSYNSNDENNLTIVELYNENTNTYEFESELHKTYNSNNQITELEERNYFWDASTISEFKLSTYTYHSSGQLLEEANFDWLPTTSEWIPKLRTDYELNDCDNPLKKLDYVIENGADIFEGQSDYHYSIFSGLFDTEPLEKVNVLPNPAQSYVQLKIAEVDEAKITIYDTEGRKFYSEQTSIDYIDIEMLPSGTFILIAEASNVKYQTLFVKL